MTIIFIVFMIGWLWHWASTPRQRYLSSYVPPVEEETEEDGFALLGHL